MRKNRVWPIWPHAVDQPKAHVLPHLWANPHSVANCYALLADDGRALLLDWFVVEVTPGAQGRHVCCTELTLGARRFGQIAEALVDVA